MIPILQSTRSLRLMNFPKSYPISRTGTGKTLSLTTSNATHKTIRPIFRRVECDIPKHCTCPACDVPVDYLMWNDGRKKSQVLCKVCQTLFSPTKDNRFSKNTVLRCPHCNHSLVHKKDRKHFIIHKCVNPKCPYYLHNLKKVDKKHLDED